MHAKHWGKSLVAIAVIALTLAVGLGCSSDDESASDTPEAASSPEAAESGQTEAAEDTSTPDQDSRQASADDEPSSEEATQTSPAAQPEEGESTTAQATTGAGTSDAAATAADDSGAGEAPSSATPQRDPSQVVELQPNQLYQGGTVVGIADLEISFEIPEGWSGGIPLGSAVMLLNSDARSGLVMALPQQDTDADQIVDAMSQPLPMDDTTVLTPNMEPSIRGPWISVSYEGSDGVNSFVGFAMALIQPEGTGILYVVTGPAEDAVYYVNLIGELASSTNSGEGLTKADADQGTPSTGTSEGGASGDNDSEGGEATTAAPSQRDPSQVVELQPDQLYQGGTLVGVASLGISFEIPEGWFGGIPQGSDVVLLRSDTRLGVVMAAAQQGIDAGQMADNMSQPLPLDAATVLTPSMQPSVRGPWISVSYTGSDGVNPLVGYAMALIQPEGTGILYVVAGPAEQAEYYLSLVGDLASSTESTEVATQAGAGAVESGEAGTSVLAQQWTQHLAGQKMTYLSSYSSEGESSVYSSAKREMFLCRDGRFFYVGESSVSVSAPGVSGSDPSQGSDTGLWRIVTQGDVAGIELRWSGGEVSTHKLDSNNGETYFDEERWYVTDDNNYC